MKNSYIIDTIRKALFWQLIFPFLLLLAALTVYIKTPKDNFFNPRPLNSKSHYENFYNRDLPHVTVEVPALYYTGFDYLVNGRVCGHYYYTLNDGYCQFYLLDREGGTAEDGPVGPVSLRGRLIELEPVEYNTLVKSMAEKLGWSAASLTEITAGYAVSTLPYPFYFNLFFYLLLYGCLFLTTFDLMLSVSYIIWPYSSPTFRYLKAFGEVRTLLPKVEMEIKHVTMAQAGSMYLTPNYMINLDTVRTLILPLQSVLWIYYHSHLSRLPGLRLRLNYTLHIVARDGRTYDFTKKKKEELDFILDIIRERRPEILTGYSEANKSEARRQVRRFEKNKHIG